MQVHSNVMLKFKYAIILFFYYSSSLIAGTYGKKTIEEVFKQENTAIFIGVCETDDETEEVTSTSNVLGIVSTSKVKRRVYQFRILKVWKGPDKEYYKVVQDIPPKGLSIPHQPPFNNNSVYLFFGWIENNVVKTYLNYPTREINPKTQVHWLKKFRGNYNQFYPGDIRGMLHLDKLASE